VTSSDSRRRRLVRQPAFTRDIEKIQRSSERAHEAVAGMERVVARIPEQGMAVPGRPGFRSFPFHTDSAAYLVIYTFNDREVVLIAVRQVRSGLF
jgi:ParE toxin of type II toxin-antitoxin system, parDE